jgi:hypothetical protein
MPSVLLLTPPVFRGIIGATPSGSSYAVAPGQTATVDQRDQAFLINGYGFSVAPPAIVAGSSSFLLSRGITANASLGTVPAASYLLRLLLSETAGHATNVSLGTSLGASDILTPTPLPASDRITVDVLTTFLLGSFAASQAIFVTLSTIGTASVDAQLDYEVGP